MSLSSKTIRVPVSLVEGRWEFLYGGAVKVVEGAQGELHLHRDYFTDRQFLEALTELRRVTILNEGTELRVAVTLKGEKMLPEHRALIKPHTAVWSPPNSQQHGHSSFISIYLGGPTRRQMSRNVFKGGLFLMLEGMEPRSIESGMVYFPEELNLEPVGSLNYAFTCLSEILEPWRMAHTGSIYKRVHYQESDGVWYPLQFLRDKEMLIAEKKLMGNFWANLASQLDTGQF